jgi:hypothetical protein
MKFTDPASGFAPDERLDALLAARPIVPAPDFVERTLERVLAESNLVSLARAGDDQALDALLDNWLSDQPVAPATAAAQAADRARRTATQKVSQPTPAPWRRRLFVFPAWVQSTGALAAAAVVAFMAFFNEGVPVAQNTSSAPMLAASNLQEHIPAPVAADDTLDTDATMVASEDDVPSLNSLSDAAALLDKDNVALLLSATQADESSIN